MDRVEAILERGRRARAVLGSETVVEAIDHIAEQLQAQWRSTTSTMTAQREILFHQVAAMDAIKRQLHQWVADAAFEQAKIDKQQDRKFRIVR
jgi:hypothetical protein